MKSYEDQRREERNPDFAPPTALYTEPSPAASKAKSVAAWREERRAAINKGVQARQARKTTNFERLDQLIGDKISSLRAEMETQQNEQPDSDSRICGEPVSELKDDSQRRSPVFTNTTQTSATDVQSAASSGSLPPPVLPGLPDMSVPPPGLPDTSLPPPSMPNMFLPPPLPPPTLPPFAMQPQPGGYHVSDQTATSTLSDIDFSQPPPPPPPEPKGKQEAMETPTGPLYARPNDPHLKPRASPAPQPAVISAPPKLLSAKPVYYQKGSQEPQELEHRAPRYERVHLHEVPMSLPVPPREGQSKEYPSQEQVHGPQQREQASITAWQRQYGRLTASQQTSGDSAVDALKPDNIPFVSPFVQRKEDLGKTPDTTTNTSESKSSS